jgi:hypothetical protein
LLDKLALILNKIRALKTGAVTSGKEAAMSDLRKKFQGRRRRIMKNDRYIRVVITAIAVCLVWICIKDVRVGGIYLFAKNPGDRGQEVYVTGGSLDVRVVEVDGTALSPAPDVYPGRQRIPQRTDGRP